MRIDETWWKVTRLVITENSRVATLERVAYFTPGDDEDSSVDSTADDPDSIEYETGERFEVPLSDSADTLAIGETVKCTLDRVVRP